MKYFLLFSALIIALSLQLNASGHGRKHAKLHPYTLIDTTAGAVYTSYPNGDTMIAASTSQCRKQDKCTINMSIVGIEKGDSVLTPMAYATVVIKHGLTGTTADEYGDAQIVTARSNVVDTLVVSYLGFPRLEYPFSRDLDHHIIFNYAKTIPGKIISCPIVR